MTNGTQNKASDRTSWADMVDSPNQAKTLGQRRKANNAERVDWADVEDSDLEEQPALEGRTPSDLGLVRYDSYDLGLERVPSFDNPNSETLGRLKNTRVSKKNDDEVLEEAHTDPASGSSGASANSAQVVSSDASASMMRSVSTSTVSLALRSLASASVNTSADAASTGSSTPRHKFGAFGRNKRRQPQDKTTLTDAQGNSRSAQSESRPKKMAAARSRVTTPHLAGARNDDDAEWEHRKAKRQKVVEDTKKTVEYQAVARRIANNEILPTQAPGTPDATDRNQSKRDWEKKVMDWRHSLEYWMKQRPV